jgi:molybdopterin molybdotransferase
MISVAQALELVLANVQSLQARRRALSESLSLVLADDVYSDIDSPPYDKALMDGYVIRLADAREGAELLVLEQITAGQTPRYPLRAGTATRIMTGAPIPVGAEAVIAIEQTRSSDDGKRVSLLRGGLNAGENILRQGAALRAGQCILQRGRELRPMEIGVLAEVGAYEVCVIPRPTIAVLATGNELVAHQDDPEPGQIRNSNGPMLLALSARANVDAFDLGIVRDDEGELKASILRGLDHNVLVMSGGVSAGVMDLIPAVLEQLGVRQVFHHLDLKPGKPLWFGVHQQENHACLVFGLPGNPVSSLVCFELFVRPAIDRLKPSAACPRIWSETIVAARCRRGSRSFGRTTG